MKYFAFLAFSLLATSMSWAQTAPNYISNFDTALAQAKQSGKPMVAIFTGKW